MRSSTRRTLAMAVFALMTAAWLLGCSRGGVPDPAESELPSDPTVARTATGMVRGLVTAEHRLFANIPYAAPPVGALRWQPPRPAAAWPGARDATKFGPRCLQDDTDLELGRQTSEDCLTLNVWTPSTLRSPKESRPVMIWIHGGSFVNGSGGLYDSRWLAARGVVVVTINYRLGALGFLAHPALGPVGTVGNYGLADQQAALRWVHDNIAGFGGDPAKVTIAGESAGGMSVCDHLVAPGSAGLFRAAIIQSGPCQAQLALPDAERISQDYARDAGCGDPAAAAQCLRDLPVNQLRKPVWYYRIGADTLSGPVTGGAVLPVDPMQAFAAGGAAKVPVLIGTNHDEFTLFVALQYLNHGQRYPADEYPGLLTGTFGADASAVADRYPLEHYGGSAALAYSAAVTDGVFACIADRMSNQFADNGDVYAYEFNDPSPPVPEPFRTLPFPIGASHSLELRYLFDVGGAPPLDASQQALSNQMLDYWAAFVTTGKPTVDGQPDWPKFEGYSSERTRMSLQPNGSRATRDFGKAHQCAFWAGLAK